MLLRLDNIQISRDELEEAYHQIRAETGVANHAVPDETDLEVVRELIVFATYASTIPSNCDFLFKMLMDRFPFYSLFNTEKRPFVESCILFFKENATQYRATRFDMPQTDTETMFMRYDLLIEYLKEFDNFLDNI